jgi:hypothetical protein
MTIQKTVELPEKEKKAVKKPEVIESDDDFIPATTKKDPIEIVDDAFSDDSKEDDDWSAVPSFLRRKK